MAAGCANSISRLGGATPSCRLRSATANSTAERSSRSFTGLGSTPNVPGTPLPSCEGLAVMNSTVTPWSARCRPTSMPVGPSTRLRSTKASSASLASSNALRLSAAIPTGRWPSSCRTLSISMATKISSSTTSTLQLMFLSIVTRRGSAMHSRETGCSTLVHNCPASREYFPGGVKRQDLAGRKNPAVAMRKFV